MVSDVHILLTTCYSSLFQNHSEKTPSYAVLNDYEEVMTSLRPVVIDDYLFEHALDAAVSCYRTEDRRTPEEAAEALYEATRIYVAELR